MTQHTELIDRLQDEIAHWSGFVIEDRAPCTLSNYLEPHVKELSDALESQSREIAALKEQVEGLRKALAPFAAYERVRSTMGGCTPKEGIIWACHARAGRAEITVEDMNAAVAVLTAKGGSDG